MRSPQSQRLSGNIEEALEEGDGLGLADDSRLGLDECELELGLEDMLEADDNELELKLDDRSLDALDEDKVEDEDGLETVEDDELTSDEEDSSFAEDMLEAEGERLSSDGEALGMGEGSGDEMVAPETGLPTVHRHRRHCGGIPR